MSRSITEEPIETPWIRFCPRIQIGHHIDLDGRAQSVQTDEVDGSTSACEGERLFGRGLQPHDLEDVVGTARGRGEHRVDDIAGCRVDDIRSTELDREPPACRPADRVRGSATPLRAALRR